MDATSLATITSLNLEAHKEDYSPIPMTEKVHNGFQAAVDALVFDVLMKPLRDNFLGGFLSVSMLAYIPDNSIVYIVCPSSLDSDD